MKYVILSVLKRDPMYMTKLKHLSIKDLIEPPQENDQYIMLITELIEKCLARHHVNTPIMDLRQTLLGGASELYQSKFSSEESKNKQT